MQEVGRAISRTNGRKEQHMKKIDEGITDVRERTGIEVAEYRKTFKGENGAEIEFKLKAECSAYEEMRNILSFVAQSSHKFYLEVAEKINSKL